MSERVAALGNAVFVPAVEWTFRRIDEAHRLSISKNGTAEQ